MLRAWIAKHPRAAQRLVTLEGENIVRLRRGVRVSGRVRRGGEPARGLRLMMRCKQAGAAPSSDYGAQTDANGAFELPDQPIGACVLATIDQNESHEFELSIPAGGVNGLDLDVAHSGATVIVEMESGASLETAGETAHRLSLIGRSGSGGPLVFKDVPPGRYILEPWDDENTTKRKIVVPPNTPEVRVQHP
jgi:hypothetical protein